MEIQRLTNEEEEDRDYEEFQRELPLWRSRTLEELRLKAAVLGIDFEEWLCGNGALWKWPTR